MGWTNCVFGRYICKPCGRITLWGIALTTFQIYIYDRQLIKYSDRKLNIDGFYLESDRAEKDLRRASTLEPRQLTLVELTDSTCYIIAIARFGKIQYVSI